jgi:hypothetical protein
MNLSITNSIAPSPPVPEHQRTTPTPVQSQPSPASPPTDTVTLSPAAQKASQAGDVDHDGDSH